MAPFFVKNRRYVLFTYAQAGPDFDYWAVVDLFAELRAECIIGREPHADGGIHFHVFVDFGRLFSSRKTDLFDVGGKHPNILPVFKTPAASYDYAIKEGDVVAGGLERPGRDCDYDVDDFWAEAAHSHSGEEFLHFLDQVAPRVLITGFNSINAYKNWKWAVAPTVYTTPSGIDFDTGHAVVLSEWLQQAVLSSGPSMKR